MLKKTLLPLFFITLLIGCGQTPQEMYSGNWKLEFNGDISSEFMFIVKPDLTFSFAEGVNVNGENYDVFFSGEVIEDGTLNGSIFYEGDNVGNLSGAIEPETGSGIWEGGGMSGTWTAVRDVN